MMILEVEPNRSPSGIDLVAICKQHPLPPCAPYFRWKSVVDRILALLLLVPGLPLIGVLVVLVRLTSRGPGVYCQTRVGQGGHIFTMYKIRTMRSDAEKRTGAVWTQVNDPRITPLGWFLRKVHLDELPQLFNVLLGDMSLVGPRPERPEFVLVLMDEIPGYTDRLAVKPGVTGLSQINLPPDTDLNSVRKKQILDLEYVHTAGLWRDIRMMLCTSLRLIGISGAMATRLTGVERMVTLDDLDDLASADDSAKSKSIMTPAALTSDALRSKLADFAVPVGEDEAHYREQVRRLLSAEPNGNGHGNDNHHSSSERHLAGNGHKTAKLVARKPR